MGGKQALMFFRVVVRYPKKGLFSIEMENNPWINTELLNIKGL